MKVNSNEVQHSCRLQIKFLQKVQTAATCRPFWDHSVSLRLTIYLQLDPVLHAVPLPHVVVGGGAGETVAVVAGLRVVEQERLCEVVVRGLVNHLTFQIYKNVKIFNKMYKCIMFNELP